MLTSPRSTRSAWERCSKDGATDGMALGCTHGRDEPPIGAMLPGAVAGPAALMLSTDGIVLGCAYGRDEPPIGAMLPGAVAGPAVLMLWCKPAVLGMASVVLGLDCITKGLGGIAVGSTPMTKGLPVVVTGFANCTG